MMRYQSLTSEFSVLLRTYLVTEDEADLYRVSEMGRQLVALGIGPDALVAAHHSALRALLVERPPDLAATLVDKAAGLLLEAMMAYALAYREHQHAEEQRLEQMRLYNQELERHERELRTIVDNILDGLILLDRQEQVRLANREVIRLLHRPLDEIIGRPIPFERLPFPAARLKEALRDIRTGQDQMIEWEVDVASTSWQIIAVPVHHGPHFFGALVIVHDVTRQRQLDRMKNDLIGLAVHELRAPLAIILGYADLIINRNLSPAAAVEYSRTIYGSAEHLTTLVDDFLTIHRLENGAIPIHPRPTSVGPLAAAIARQFDATTHRHRILSTIGTDLPRVLADPDRVIQVLTNLVSNAIKYSPHGGTIRLDARIGKTEVIVSVIDQGLGLPREAIPSLFGKFYRVPTPDRQNITGTGLGLAICQQIIAAHQGRIWAESDGPGRGSRFSFSLPIAFVDGRGEVDGSPTVAPEMTSSG